LNESEMKSLTVVENERRYVARELHDGLAQTTQQLGLEIAICRKLLERGNLDMLAEELAQLEQRLQVVAIQVREVIADMRPPSLEPEATLRDYLQAEIERHRQRGGVPVDFSFDWPSTDLPAQQKLALSRIVQEALLNVRKHAAADQVQIVCAVESNQAQLSIVDNGQGFEPAIMRARPVDQGGAGLANMQSRAEALGGTLTVESSELGGTRIVVTLDRQPG
jgi:two-component system sensor histidine kinase DegS